MSKDEDEETYEVGYRRPPRATQFKKGQSGNLRGRGKGRLNLATLLERELQASITVVENGKARRIRKGSAIIKQTVNKAVGGDPKQIAAVLAHARHQDATKNGSSPSSLNSEEDHIVMENIKQRMMAAIAASKITAVGEVEGPRPTLTSKEIEH
jgi:hypothetical protein